MKARSSNYELSSQDAGRNGSSCGLGLLQCVDLKIEYKEQDNLGEATDVVALLQVPDSKILLAADHISHERVCLGPCLFLQSA